MADKQEKNMSSSAAFTPDHHHHPPPSEQLTYVHCNFCETVLAVGVPCTSLAATVTVRCGHCTNLLSVNMRAHRLPPAAANHLRMAELRHCHSNRRLINQPIPDLVGPVRVDELLKPNRLADVGGKKDAEARRKDAVNVGARRMWKRMVMVMVIVIMLGKGMSFVNRCPSWIYVLDNITFG